MLVCHFFHWLKLLPGYWHYKDVLVSSWSPVSELSNPMLSQAKNSNFHFRSDLDLTDEGHNPSPEKVTFTEDNFSTSLKIMIKSSCHALGQQLSRNKTHFSLVGSRRFLVISSPKESLVWAVLFHQACFKKACALNLIGKIWQKQITRQQRQTFFYKKISDWKA